MCKERVWSDIAFLAGRLPHRGGVTENERAAAEYVLEGFKSSTALAQIEDFYSTDAYPYIFAMYYVDFCLGVVVLGLWWPLGCGRLWPGILRFVYDGVYGLRVGEPLHAAIRDAKCDGALSLCVHEANRRRHCTL